MLKKCRNKITNVKIVMLNKEVIIPVFEPIKNIVINAINVGKRPLQGTNTLVKIAIKRSRGESIILQPVTPQALHPKPMHMVSACFPHALHF